MFTINIPRDVTLNTNVQILPVIYKALAVHVTWWSLNVYLFCLRASMASAKDRLDSLEKQLQSNRQLMTKQAKKAAKLEKKLKILTGGYLSRSGTLVKQVTDLHEQSEQAFVERETFKRLQELEEQAIPKRMEVDCIWIVFTHCPFI